MRVEIDLQAIVGADNLVPPDQLAAYAVDGLIPRAVARPADAEQVAALVRLAAERDRAIAPRGGGTALDLGNPPRRLDLMIDLTRLDRVVEHEPADLTVTAQAGITLGALQAHLARHGQWLPFDPPLAARATLGGLLATNASGPTRLRHGGLRDLIIGLRVVQADGSLVHGGGRVVKNVAGYDLTKLHIGALGTLGLIVEVSAKLMPLPSARGTLLARFPGAEAAAHTSVKLRGGVLMPAALAICTAPIAADLPLSLAAGEYLVAVGALGTEAGVERVLRDAAALVEATGGRAIDRLATTSELQHDRLWTVLREWGRNPDQLAAVQLKLSVLPTKIGAALDAIAALPSPGDGVCAPLIYGHGLGWLCCWPGPAVEPTAGRAWMAELTRRIGALGGTVVIERCPLAWKEGLDVWGPTGPDLAVMRRIKAEFDPDGRLNPGRFVGGI